MRILLAFLAGAAIVILWPIKAIGDLASWLLGRIAEWLAKSAHVDSRHSGADRL